MVGAVVSLIFIAVVSLIFIASVIVLLRRGGGGAVDSHKLTIYFDWTTNDMEELDALAAKVCGSQPTYKGGDLNIRKLEFRFSSESALERAQDKLLDDGRFRLFP